MNLGDEAILEGILSQLRATVPADITVFSRNPADTLARHKVERAVSSALADPQGDHAGDPSSSISSSSAAAASSTTRRRELPAGGRSSRSELGVPVMLYAISAGPLTTQASQAGRARGAQRARRRPSSPCATGWGTGCSRTSASRSEIHLTADPAFLLEPEELPVDALKAEGVEFDRHLVGFSVREPGPAAPDIDPDEYYALLANAADFIVERYDADVVFVPMEKTDVQHSHAVVAHMQNAERAEILRRRYSPRQILDLMGRFEFAVGHAAALPDLRGAARHAVRGAPYASKVTRPARGSGDGHAAARQHRHRPAHRPHRPLLGHARRDPREDRERLPALKRRAARRTSSS